MQVALIAFDKPGSLDLRKANRDAHLAYVADTGCVAFGGPFLDDNGDMCGSLLVLNVDTLEDAEAWADGDPYAKAGLFAQVTLRHWNRVIN